MNIKKPVLLLCFSFAVALVMILFVFPVNNADTSIAYLNSKLFQNSKDSEKSEVSTLPVTADLKEEKASNHSMTTEQKKALLVGQEIGQEEVSRGGSFRDPDVLRVFPSDEMQKVSVLKEDSVPDGSFAQAKENIQTEETAKTEEETQKADLTIDNKTVSPVKEKQTESAAVQPESRQQADKETSADASSKSSSELDLLARLITAEAQGEPYEAQVGVGAVVINRVQSGVWANSIEGVIYQNINGYYQFTPVVNGWINKPAQPESIKAAQAALNGADPTNGAQFYYDDKATNSWILSKPVSLKIGHMIFAF